MAALPYSSPEFSGSMSRRAPDASPLPPFLPPDVAAAQLGCCSLLLLNLPSAPEALVHVGFDCALWKVGANFSGVKCIQPGCHVLYSLLEYAGEALQASPSLSASASAADAAPGDSSAFECMYSSMRVEEAIGGCKEGVGEVQSEFLFFAPNSVCVRRWNPKRSRFERLKDADEEERFVRAVRRLELDKKLGVYPQQYVHLWSVLTDYVSQSCLERVEPVQSLFASLPLELTQEEEALLVGAASAKTRAKRQGGKDPKKSVTWSGENDEKREDATDVATREGGGKAEEEEEVELDFSRTPVARFYFSEVPSLRATAVAAARRAETEAKRRGATAVAAKALGAQALTREAVDRSLGLLMLLQDLQKLLAEREGAVKRQAGGKKKDAAAADKSSEKGLHATSAEESGAHREQGRVREETGEAPKEEQARGEWTQKEEEEREKEEWKRIERSTWLNLLGEIQLAYLAFLLGHRFDGFDQWKQLVILLSQSERAVRFLPDFYAAFLRLFYCQLEQCPDDLLQDSLLQRSFLVSAAMSLVRNCSNLLPSASSAAALPSASEAEGGLRAEGRGEEEEEEESEREALRSVQACAHGLEGLLRETFQVGGEAELSAIKMEKRGEEDFLFLDEDEDGPVIVDEAELRRAGCLPEDD
ncbi:AAR2 protein [Besnoitia besnoiti]|uniref:AAR2 protein n=1 Tax=Besnoitia besnoiti TaxID=94643 RepID=A0A2A9MG43_BESBE|nr:AAR2 protein [Besnoitia besnoiti]PFH34360.1 AAR2 protein [Besnoitia besnoiti]